MDFDVVYNESSNTVTVTSWGKPNIVYDNSGSTTPPVEEEEETSNNGYQEVYFDPSDSSTLAWELADAGLEEVIYQGVYSGIIADSYYIVTYVYSVSQKIEGNWLYYLFDFFGDDGYGNSARFTYIVSYDMNTASSYLEDYQISNVSKVW